MNNGIFRKGMAVALTFLMITVVFAGMDFATMASAQSILDLPINPDRATPYDLDGDGINDYVFDSTGDGKYDHYYGSKSGTVQAYSEARFDPIYVVIIILVVAAIAVAVFVAGKRKP
jgi:hypothetical protein